VVTNFLLGLSVNTNAKGVKKLTMLEGKCSEASWAEWDKKQVLACAKCGQTMKHWINPKTKKKEKYMWKCNCSDLVVSVG
jgi:hypothetical protein